MKLHYLLFVVSFIPLDVIAQRSSSSSLTFQSSPMRLNTRPLFEAKKTPVVDEKKEKAKAVTDWRQSGHYHIADHFVAGDWQKINGTVFTETTTNGQSRLRMAQTEQPGLYVIKMPYDFKQNDFTIEVVVEDRDNLPLAGMVYGLADKDNYYSFLINPKGEYRVDGMLEGESLGIMPRFVKSVAIRAKGPNTLKIDKKGSQVRYLINGQKVHEGRFINFAGANIGYYVQSPEVFFKDFAVRLQK